jgi:hypothetical protein
VTERIVVAHGPGAAGDYSTALTLYDDLALERLGEEGVLREAAADAARLPGWTVYGSELRPRSLGGAWAHVYLHGAVPGMPWEVEIPWRKRGRSVTSLRPDMRAWVQENAPRRTRLARRWVRGDPAFPRTEFVPGGALCFAVHEEAALFRLTFM